MKTPKTLTYVSAEPEREGHASFTHVHEIIKGLKSAGWQVDLFSPCYDDAKLPSVFSRFMGISQMNLRVLLSKRPKVYYMRWHFAVFPVALFAKILGIPTVIEVNGQVIDLYIAWPITRRFGSLFRWLMEVQLRWAAGIIAVAQGLADMSRGIVGEDTIIAVVPNGADVEHFTPNAAKTLNATTQALPEKFMVFFGTLAPWQGTNVILAAVEEDAWPKGIDVVFAGDGVERPVIEAAANRLDHVHYLGRVPYDELPSVVARALGSIVCSENLGGRVDTGASPLKLYESMACATAIISANLPFQAEVVKNSACGYVIESGDPQGLASAVSKLVNDPDQLDEMSQNARDAAVRDHSWKVRAIETDVVLQQVLAKIYRA